MSTGVEGLIAREHERRVTAEARIASMLAEVARRAADMAERRARLAGLTSSMDGMLGNAKWSELRDLQAALQQIAQTGEVS